MHPKHRGVALLLSLGSLPIGLAGCNKDDDENTHIGSQGPITSDGDSDAPTTSSTGTDELDTTVTASTAGTTTSDPTTSGPTTSGPTTNDLTTGDFTTSGPPDPTTGEPPPPTAEVCILYGQRVGMCPGYDPIEAASTCQQILDSGTELDGQACRETMEAFYVCLTKQDCESIPYATGCGDEFQLLATDCPMFYSG